MSHAAPAISLPPRATPIKRPWVGFVLGLAMGLLGLVVAAYAGAPRVRAWAGYGLVARALAFASLISIGLAYRQLAPKTQLVTSEDCACSFELPRAMRATRDLNDVADLQYKDVSRPLYLVDIVESRQDVVADSASAYAALSALKRDTSVPFHETTLGGLPAVRRTFTEQGAKNGDVNAYMVEVVVRTDRHYHHIIAWTLASKRAELGVEIDDMVASFRALEAP